jgi:Calpain family cysteine protease
MYKELGTNFFLTAEGLNSTMWGPLLEKAYAKFVGSYLSLARGGVSSEAVRALTGFPGFVFNSSSTENVWQTIRNAIFQGDIVTCST